MTDTVAAIEKLVAQVVKDVASSSVTLHERMDALKLLQPYYIVLKKAKGKSDDESGDEPTMNDLQRRLRVVEQEPADDGIAVTTRRSRNPV